MGQDDVKLSKTIKSCPTKTPSEDGLLGHGVEYDERAEPGGV